MPAWPQDLASPVAANVAVVTTTETVVATLAGVSTWDAQRRVELQGFLTLTSGTATTAVTLRVRRGVDATGTLIGAASTQTLIGAAGSTQGYGIQVVDTPGDLAAGSYVLTVQQTAATANGTAVTGQINAQVI